jgi:hypothetical protein
VQARLVPRLQRDPDRIANPSCKRAPAVIPAMQVDECGAGRAVPHALHQLPQVRAYSAVRRPRALVPCPNWPAGRSCHSGKLRGPCDLAGIEPVRPDEGQTIGNAARRIGVPALRLSDPGLDEVDGEHLEDSEANRERCELTDDLATVWSTGQGSGSR